jgi:hypothetical protein
MNNIEEKVIQLTKMFERVSKNPPLIGWDKDGINIANGSLTICDTEMEVKSIKGTIKVPAFELSKFVYQPSNNRWEPDGGDVVELSVKRQFDEIAKDAIVAFIEEQLDSFLDFLATEEQAKELFG